MRALSWVLLFLKHPQILIQFKNSLKSVLSSQRRFSYLQVYLVRWR